MTISRKFTPDQLAALHHNDNCGLNAFVSNGWIAPHDNDDSNALETTGLNADFGRGLYIAGVAPKTDDVAIKTALLRELAENEFGENHEETLRMLVRSYAQRLQYFNHYALLNANTNPSVFAGSELTLTNIWRGSDGKVYLDLVSGDIHLRDSRLQDENGLPRTFFLPGTLHSRFQLTQQGLKFLGMEASNSLLESQIANASVGENVSQAQVQRVRDEFNQKTRAIMLEEIESLQIVMNAMTATDYNLKVSAQNIINQMRAFILDSQSENAATRQLNLKHLEKYVSVLALTKQILVDPYNKSLVLALEMIYNPISPSQYQHPPAFKEALQSLNREAKAKQGNYQRFAPYLSNKKVNRILRRNIATYTNLDEAANYFNNLSLEYDEAGDMFEVGSNNSISYSNPLLTYLVENVEQDLRNNTFNSELYYDYMKAIAINELFDDQGAIKPEILAVLNESGMQAHFNGMNEELKHKLIHTYILAFVSPQVMNKLGDLHAQEQMMAFSELVNHDAEQQQVVDAAYIQALDARILGHVQNQQNTNHAVKKSLQFYLDSKNSPDMVEYVQARTSLVETTKDVTKNNGARFNGRALVNGVNDIAYNPSFKEPQKIPLLARVMSTTRDTINDPSPENNRRSLQLAKEVHKYKWGRIVAGCALGVLGALIIGASVGVAVVTFGAGAHLGIFGAILGAHVIGAGISAGTGISLGLSVTAFGGWFAGKASRNSKNLHAAVQSRARSA